MLAPLHHVLFAALALAPGVIAPCRGAQTPHAASAGLCTVEDVVLTAEGAGCVAPRLIRFGDFEVALTASMSGPSHAILDLCVGADVFRIDGGSNLLHCASSEGVRTFLEKPFRHAVTTLSDGQAFDLAVERKDGSLRIRWNRDVVYENAYARDTVGRVQVRLLAGAAHVKRLRVTGSLMDDPCPADLFAKGRDGSAYYRIPSLLALPGGVLLAFAEARRDAFLDTGNIDIVLKRSTDDGRTWGPMELVYEEGGDAPVTCTNLSPLYDRDTGRVWLFFLVCSRWNAGDFKLMRMVSDDAGRTWSAPEDIRTTVGNPKWLSAHPGPGHGIQLRRGPHAGRLMAPGWYYMDKQHGVFVLYSDDHGKTWRRHEPVAVGPNETMLGELSTGGVVAMMRQVHRSASPWRLFATSTDGVNWTAQRPIQDFRSVECQASVLSLEDAEGSPGALLFCHPGAGNYADTRVHRAGLTLRSSFDDGRTWPVAELVYPGRCAYSDMAMLSDGRVGILFENGDIETYGRISFVAWSPAYARNALPGEPASWRVVDGWGADASQSMTNVTGIAVDDSGRIYVAGGAGKAVVVLNPDGTERTRWGDFLKAKHGLRIFGDRVYVTDTADHVVIVCDLDGRIVKTLGVKGESGHDEAHFFQPTDVAVADDGTLYIADGYGNSRIVCLGADDRHLFSWGSPGSRPGQFKYPHNLVVSGDRVYVADRGNRRIQVFDRLGNLLEVWTHVGKPFGLAVADDGTLYVSHIVSPYGVQEHGVMHLTREGEVLERFGTEGRRPGQFLVPHSLALSPDQTRLYVGEVSTRRVQCFARVDDSQR
jgi:sugar lactone lactonase YvrE